MPDFGKWKWPAVAVGILLFAISLAGQSWVRKDVVPEPDPATGRVVRLTLDKGQPKGYLTLAGDLSFTGFSALGGVGFFLAFSGLMSGVRFPLKKGRP